MRALGVLCLVALSACPSTPGAQGPKGDPGPAGPQGLVGPQGPANGPPGPQGEVGPPGAQGTQGPLGPQGAQGNQGLQGVAGPQGEPGPPGQQGTQGQQGPQGVQGLQGPGGPAGPVGPVAPTLLSPAAHTLSLTLSVPGVTPIIDSVLSNRPNDFDVEGFSGYDVTSAGATPLLVLSRGANVDTAYFLSRVADQASLGTAVLSFVNAQNATIPRQLLIHGATVDAVSSGWSYEVIVLRYTSLSEQYPDGGVTTPVAPDPGASVTPDFSLALASPCTTCSGLFRADAPGSSTVSGYTDWNRTDPWAVTVWHAASGTRVRAQVLLRDAPSVNTVLQAISTQAPQSRFDLRLLNGASTLVTRFECDAATLTNVRRGTDGRLQAIASMSQCDGAWQRVNQTGAPVGAPTTFTSP